jgi:hypothetical protein
MSMWIGVIGWFLFLGHVYASSLSYYNPLNDPALNNDFFSKTKAGNGTFEVQNSRLEFSTSTYCVAVKEFLVPLNVSESFSVSLNVHLNNGITGLNLGDQIKVGFGISNQSLTTSDDYINKATVYLKRDSNFPSSTHITSGSLSLRGSWTDVVLKADYDSVTKSFTGSYKAPGDEFFTASDPQDLGAFWGLQDGESLYFYLYGASQLNYNLKMGAQVFSGDMYMTNLNIVPEPSSLSLIALGGAVAALRRRQ